MDMASRVLGGALDTPKSATEMVEVRPATMTDQLKRRKENLEKQLENINAAIAAIEKNPGVQEAFDALSRVGLY